MMFEETQQLWHLLRGLMGGKPHALSSCESAWVIWQCTQMSSITCIPSVMDLSHSAGSPCCHWSCLHFRQTVNRTPGLSHGTHGERRWSIVYMHRLESLYSLGFPFGDNFNLIISECVRKQEASLDPKEPRSMAPGSWLLSRSPSVQYWHRC